MWQRENRQALCPWCRGSGLGPRGSVVRHSKAGLGPPNSLRDFRVPNPEPRAPVSSVRLWDCPSHIRTPRIREPPERRLQSVRRHCVSAARLVVRGVLGDELVSERTNLENQRLTQTGLVATTRTEYLQAKREAEVAESLGLHGGMSRNDAALAKDKAAELETRYGIEQQRLALMTETIDSQLAVQRSQVDRMRAVAEFQQNVLRSLQVRAGDSGVVSDLTLQLGQYVLGGTMLAKVVQPGKLKAVLQIPETQAKDITIGQKAAIDTRNGIVPGHVIRFDPNAINGTVAVDVALEDTVAGMRPDLSVDGTIEIERLERVLYTGRPAYGQPNSTIGMFKITDDGRYANRVQVQVGRSSVNTIEVLRGLSQRDSVILSDMSQWDNVERVRIKR